MSCRMYLPARVEERVTVSFSEVIWSANFAVGLAVMTDSVTYQKKAMLENRT